MNVLNKSLENIESLIEYLRNKGDNYIFRGCTCKDYVLSPSAYRDCLNDDIPDILYYAEREHNALLNVIKKFVNKENYFYAYYYGQHYGFKTRLLDFSWDPLVALVFACAEWSPTNIEKTKDIDGILYVLDSKKYKKLDLNNYEDLGNLLVCHGDNISKHGDVDLSVVNFIDPNKDVKRLKNQEGCFLLFPQITEEIYEIKNEDCDEIIIIPAKLKEEILKYIREKYDITLDKLQEI